MSAVNEEAVVSGRRRASPQEERTGVMWWLGQIVSWLILLIVLAVAAVMIVVPRVGGATAYTVLTGSMEPGMPPGSLAVVRPVDPAHLRTGDVITYQLKSGEPAVVTHRIVGVGATTRGELRFTTRGDANTAEDPPVQPEQIRGRLWYQMPWLGYVNTALTGSQRQWLSVAIAAGLFGYAALMLGSAWRERRERNRTS